MIPPSLPSISAHHCAAPCSLSPSSLFGSPLLRRRSLIFIVQLSVASYASPTPFFFKHHSAGMFRFFLAFNHFNSFHLGMPSGLSSGVKIQYGSRHRHIQKSVVVRLNKTTAQLLKERKERFNQLAGKGDLPILQQYLI